MLRITPHILTRGVIVCLALAGAGLSASCTADEATETEIASPIEASAQPEVAPTTDVPATEPSETGENALTTVTIGLPFQADIQFAPVYVADALSRDDPAGTGLQMRFEYGNENDFLRLLASGQMDAVVASGEQVILARAGGLPVTYVATWYQRFPVVVFGLDPALDSATDLVGKKVGLPMQAGASWIGWQALLAQSGIPLETIETEELGYDQLGAVREGRVAAAVGYAANEPLQLRSAGETPGVIEIADAFNLVSNGIVVSEASIRERPELVQAIVDRFLRGLAETIDNPDAAFETSLEAVPAAADEAVRDLQRQVLEESLRFWNVPEGTMLGRIDSADWTSSVTFLEQIGLLETDLDVSDLIDASFVEQADILR